MPRSHFFGTRCQCGHVIAVRELGQSEAVELEELQHRLRKESWSRLIVHGPYGCMQSVLCTPDDLVVYPGL